MEQGCYAIRTSEKLGLTLNPHPLNKEDIMNCNGDLEDDFETCLDDHERLSSILEPQGNVCKLHLEIETGRSFEQLVKEQEKKTEPVSVDGITEECDSPFRESNTALEKKEVKQDICSGSVVKIVVECNSPNCEVITALDRNMSRDDHGVFKARVSIAKFRNDEGLARTKSNETNKFSITLVKAGRGVAELLIDPVSQSWRAKPNQKEFLKKIDDVENFKKNDEGKRNEDFRNDDGLDKAEGFKKTNYFRQTEDLKGSNGNLKKNDDPEKNGNPELISNPEIMSYPEKMSSPEIVSICEMMRNSEPGKCSAPIIEPEPEEEEPDDDSDDKSVPFSGLAFHAGRGVAGELLIDSVLRSFVMRSLGLVRYSDFLTLNCRLHEE